MPMIDLYAVEGAFGDKHTLARDLAAAVMRWEQVPLTWRCFRNNTAAFIHDLAPPDSFSNVVGDSDYVRVKVLTPVGVPDQHKNSSAWLGNLRTSSPARSEILGWRSGPGFCSPSRRRAVGGLLATAYTGADLAEAARAQIAQSAQSRTSS